MKQIIEWLRKTERIYFPNGLTLLMHPLENSEAAALHFCVKAGYFCETDSEVGLAHLLEHMYFKGSAGYPEPGTMGIRMKALGGMLNASTSYDQTNYFCEVPAVNLPAALDIMSDAFAAPLFPEDELRKECEVVIEEFNRKLDNPSAYSQELLIQLAYTQHRMKRWRIGTPEQLRSYTRDHLFDYFHRYYQPQNMVITVTGKFDPREIRKSIDHLLSPMKNRNLMKDFGPEEPPQNGIRYAAKKAIATQSYLHWGFHAPGVLHPDGPVVECLVFLLSGGRSSRLHRHLVERKRSASSASCYYIAYENIGLLMLTAITEAEKIRTAGEDAWSVLTDLHENGITAGELQKIKNKLRLHQAMQTEEALGLAELLAYYEAYGSYERIEQHINRMQEVTEEEIVKAAATYIRMENLSVLEYVNAEIPEISVDEYKIDLGKVARASRVRDFAGQRPALLTPRENPIRVKTLQEPEIRKGHATYILQPDTHYPFIAAGIFFLGGRNEESSINAGITHLLHRAALKGTSDLNAEQLASRFDALGNPPRFNCYRDFSGFTMEAMPEYFPEMWNLLIACILDARFPATEVETEKGKVISVIRRNMDDNFVRPMQLFHRAFFGTHPYALPETGLEETMTAMEREQLLSWKKRLWNSRRAIVTIVGSFETGQMFDLLESGMAGLNETGDDLKPPAPLKAPARHMEVENRTKKQTAFVLGFSGPPATSGEIPSYDALQQILSGMGGRLFLNLRSKKALAYTVHASTFSALHGGAFVTYIAGEAAKEAQSLEAMWQELEELKKHPVAAGELENARHALIGNYTLSTQTANSRVLDYTNSLILGHKLPYAPVYRELVQKVTTGELQEVAQRTFQEEKSAMAVVRGTTETTETEKIIAAS